MPERPPARLLLQETLVLPLLPPEEGPAFRGVDDRDDSLSRFPTEIPHPQPLYKRTGVKYLYQILPHRLQLEAVFHILVTQ
jgi:hypothetical protein